VVGRPTWYARFLARALWDPLAEEVLTDHPAASSLRLLRPRWSEALPQLPAVLRRHRLEQLVALVVGTLAGWEWARERNTPRLEPTLLVADLVASGTAMITAPGPEGPHRTVEPATEEEHP
jgi:hypothetical protein